MASSLHNLVGRFIANSLDEQLPRMWRAVTEFPVGSRLQQGERPCIERRPDFAVVTHTAALRAEPAMFCEMAIWGEVVSSSNQRKDIQELPVAFFDSDCDDHCGRISHISHYWQIHVDPRHGLVAALIHNYDQPDPKWIRFQCATSHDPPGSKVISVEVPFRLHLDLGKLVAEIGFDSPSPVRRIGLRMKRMEFKNGNLIVASPLFEF